MRARTKEPTTDAAPKEAKVRQRLSTHEREQQIVKGAITFFSERGLEGQTRDLAKDIGITHPLLYHYFPTKQALIERVYQEVYPGRWKREWEVWLDDKNVSLEEKLTHFYLDYAKTILTPEWVRIMVFSGLSDGYIPDKYLALLRQKLFPRIVNESRRHLGLSLRRKVTERESELLWGLHGGIFYIGIRQWVYNQPAPEDLTQIIKDRVRAYIVAAHELFGADE
ncbi:MAG TPA: TetR family transcriptional regulator [Oxalobacteraceae bacterium]|nr:TetR family transcriptional regulator [Oxalobacteraceae bacterium]